MGKASQVIGQAIYGAIVFLLLGPLGIAAYQIAILSLIVTMLIGLWLVWPVSDRWAGSGEMDGGDESNRSDGGTGASSAPPPRLSPDRAPLGDRR